MNLTNASKTNEVKSLARAGRYEEAAQMADRINLDRVESQHDMFVVADVYLKVGRPEDAKAVYLRLYERGKNHRVMVGLIDLCLKTKNPQQAEQFLREFRKMEPDNPERLVFRYRVDCQLGKSTEYLLKSLTKLRDEDYTDIWALELAKVYYKSGDYAACAKECKNICIWFDGTEVSRKAKVLWQSCKEKGVRLDGDSYQVKNSQVSENASEDEKKQANAAAAMAVAETAAPIDEMAVSADLSTAAPRAMLEESVFEASANANAAPDMPMEDIDLADSIGAVVSDVMQEDAMEAAMLRYNRIMEETKQVVPAAEEPKDPDGGVTLELDLDAINEAIDAVEAEKKETEEAPQVMSDDLSEDELAQALEEQASWALAQKIEDEDELRMAQEMAAASSQHPEEEGDYSVAWGLANADTLEKSMETDDDMNKELSPAYIAAVSEANEPETSEEAEADDEEEKESDIIEEPPVIETPTIQNPTPLYATLGLTKEMEDRIERIIFDDDDDDDDDDEYVITGYFEDKKEDLATTETELTEEAADAAITVDEVAVEATDDSEEPESVIQEKTTEALVAEFEAELAADLAAFGEDEVGDADETVNASDEAVANTSDDDVVTAVNASDEDEVTAVNASDEDEAFSVEEEAQETIDAEEAPEEKAVTSFDDIEVTDEGPVITADYEVVEPHQMELFDDIELKLDDVNADESGEAALADAVQAMGEETWVADMEGVPVDFETTKDLGDLDAQIESKLAARRIEDEEPEEEPEVSVASLDELVPETAADSGMKEIFTVEEPVEELQLTVEEPVNEPLPTVAVPSLDNLEIATEEPSVEPQSTQPEESQPVEEEQPEEATVAEDEAEKMLAEAETTPEREMAPGQAPGKTKTLDELVAAKLGAMEEEERKVREEKPLTEEQKAERAALQAMFKEDDAAIERALYDLIGGKKTE